LVASNVLTTKVALCHAVTFYVSNCNARVWFSFNEINFFPDIVVMLSTKHFFLKQILTSVLIWENK